MCQMGIFGQVQGKNMRQMVERRVCLDWQDIEIEVSKASMQNRVKKEWVQKWGREVNDDRPGRLSKRLCVLTLKEEGWQWRIWTKAWQNMTKILFFPGV